MIPRAVAAAIIAGGRAERLGGVPKGTLLVGGRRIVDRQLEVLATMFGRVFLVANDPAPWAGLPVAIVPDRVAGAGPLAGIDAALAALEPHENAVVCVAGDMPLLAGPLLALLRDRAPEADAVVPRVGGYPEPLLARYGRGCAGPVSRRLGSGLLKTADLLTELTVAWVEEGALRLVDPELRSLSNVNTPEDLARMESLKDVRG